jgi:hypothetical protein
MKKLLGFICAVTLVLGVVGSASALILDFEDLYTSSFQAIPNGYGGFNWNAATQIGVINADYHPDSGYDYGSVSGDMAAFNYYGDTPSDIDLVGFGTFTFNGAWFTSAWYDQTISFGGYNNGSLLYTSSNYSINTTDPLWIALDWSGIDRLEINSTNYQWVMDNFTYNESAPVPEPSTILLVGTGLLGIIGFGRKRLNKKA